MTSQILVMYTLSNINFSFFGSCNYIVSRLLDSPWSIGHLQPQFPHELRKYLERIFSLVNLYGFNIPFVQ